MIIQKLKENQTNKIIALWIKKHAHDLRVVGGMLIVLAIVFLVISAFWETARWIVTLFSLLSSLCIGSPHYAQWVIPEKLVKDMNYDEILSFIVATDPNRDWEGISKEWTSEVFLKEDPRLRFRAKYIDDGVQNDDFQDEWANRHPHPKAIGYWYDLYLDGNLIDRFVLVSVDGGRGTLPTPDHPSGKVKLLDYRVAQIHDKIGNLDEYIQRSGLEVE